MSCLAATDGCGVEHAPAAADAVSGRGQDPGNVRGGRQRDPVGVAGERAAVDHGQSVRLACVDSSSRSCVMARGDANSGPAASTRTPAGPVA